MFVRSYKVPSRRLLSIGFVFLAAVVLVVYGVGQKITKTDVQAKVVESTKPSKNAMRNVAKTAADRLEFIAQFGWQVAEEPTEIAEIIVPEEFDEVYEEYNILQKKQGYDLLKYAGKRCKRYTYQITNYAGCPDNARINLLVLDTKVIGGDVCSEELGGFMHGFSPDSAALAEAQSLPTPELDETAVMEGGITISDETALEETVASDLADIVDALGAQE